MARVFAEDSNNDIYLGNNNQILILEDLDAVLQACRAAIEIQQGEAIYAQENGMPNMQIIWGGTPNLQQFDSFAREQILGVTDVEEVESFSSAQVDDTLEYEATIKTIYGTDSINGSI